MKTLLASESWKILKTAALIICVFLFNCCATENLKLGDIPVPPGAIKGVAELYLKTSVQTTETLRLISIKERFGNYEKEIYTLPGQTEWRQVAQFYDAELAKHNFQRLNDFLDGYKGSDIIYYERSSFLAKNRIAVSLIDVFDGKDRPQRYFLLISVSE